MANVNPKAVAFMQMLTEGDAFIGVDKRSGNPYIYMGVGEDRFYVKKVNVHDEETNKMSSKWITATIKTDAEAKADAAMAEAYKQLIADGTIPAPEAPAAKPTA